LNFGPSVIGCVEGFIDRLEKLKAQLLKKKEILYGHKKTFWQKI